MSQFQDDLKQLDDSLTRLTCEQDQTAAMVCDLNRRIQESASKGLLPSGLRVVGEKVWGTWDPRDGETQSCFWAAIQVPEGLGIIVTDPRDDEEFSISSEWEYCAEFVPFAACEPVVQAKLRQVRALFARVLNELPRSALCPTRD